MIKFMDLSFQNEMVLTELNNIFHDVLKNNSYIGGSYIEEFGNNFKSTLNVEHFVPCGNGTDALEIAIEALSLKPGSNILVPCNSFIASSEAVTRCGHNVVFVPVDKETHLIDFDLINNYVTEKVGAVIAVHLYGNPLNIPLLKEILNNDNIKIIEDCAQAHLAHYDNQYVGSMGDVSAWSFYPGKNLGALGDAGGITTNDDEIALKCKMIANHGRVEKYNHIFEGRNSRLDNLQAGFLMVKLKYLSEWTNKRIQNASIYNMLFKDSVNVKPQVKDEKAFHVYHLYVVKVKNRDELKKYLLRNGVETGIHYPILLPKLTAYEYLHLDSSDYLFQDDISEDLLSLPVAEHINQRNIERIVELINEFYNQS